MTDTNPPGPETPERNLLERASDEVKSWFGDPNAAGRRQRDLATGDHTGQGPHSDLDPDERIVDDIGRKLTEDPTLDASRMKVESRDGLVSLSGEARSSDQRARAEALASETAGVTHVDNRLSVV
ncbi:MAG TPA: BON domain-containing protein [Caulobacteraceae bacterium]|jgi:osmotically-inducible protein OsmY